MIPVSNIFSSNVTGNLDPDVDTLPSITSIFRHLILKSASVLFETVVQTFRFLSFSICMCQMIYGFLMLGMESGFFMRRVIQLCVVK